MNCIRDMIRMVEQQDMGVATETVVGTRVYPFRVGRGNDQYVIS
jgi:hypothetical protein